ncbi:MAG: NAD(P)-binding domain-containing protein [Ignavibacteriaceae bacterium]
MDSIHETEKFKVIVIGAGQAGLSTGYYLREKNIPFVILDANKRIGDSWRNRWDSLHLFTPAKFDCLPGLTFPASPNYFPTKDEMADYLENYAAHFNLPVRTGVKVDGLSREGNSYCIKAGDKHFQAEHVIIAMSNYQNPKIPQFAKELNPDIVQLHSFDYRNQSQLKDGGVLVVGAGNSGAELALESAKNNHNVWLSGRDVGHIPFHIESTLAKIILVRLVIRFLFHRILTINTPIGRKARPKITSHGGPLIRIKPKEFETAGIKRVSKVAGVKDGLPLLENKSTIDVKNVVWCTGFYPSFSWIDIPIYKGRELSNERGIVKKEPGLYFVGLHFLFSLSSAMIHGVSRDAEFVVKKIYERINSNDVQV